MKENVLFRAGSELGDHVHKPILIVKSLYGLRGSGKVWRYDLSYTLWNELHLNNALQIRTYSSRQKKDGSKYYPYILLYIDEILIIDNNPGKYMNMLKDVYTVKKDSIHELDVYLGANVQKLVYRRGKSICWRISCE